MHTNMVRQTRDYADPYVRRSLHGAGMWRATVLALCPLLFGPPFAHGGTPLLLTADPTQSASDPRVRFWEALVASGLRPGAEPGPLPHTPWKAPGTPSVAATAAEAVHASPEARPEALVAPEIGTPAATISAGVMEATDGGMLNGLERDVEANRATAPLELAIPESEADVPFVDVDAATQRLPPTEFTFTIHPRNDATVVAAKPNAAYGTTPDLRARGARAEQRSYLEFVVVGAGPAVQRATLRLYCVDGSDDGGSVHAIATRCDGVAPTWTQEELSWNNAPRLRPDPLARLGRVVAGGWVEVDVSGAIDGDGTYGFALVSNANDMVAFEAREGQAPPELVFTSAIRCEEGNTLPVAIDDAYVLATDAALESFAPGLLENDTDTDGDLLALVSSTQPAHGVLVATNDGSFTYRPQPGYFGPDSFTYCIGDGRGGTSAATVAITVQPGIGAPENWPAAQARPGEREGATPGASLTRIVPNPSRGGTWIEFELARDSHVEASIYDARGHRVRVVAVGRRPAGRQQLLWNGADDRGDALPVGIYFLRLQLGEISRRHKIILQH